MKEALKGIEADLKALRDRRNAVGAERDERVQKIEDEYESIFKVIDEQMDALEQARSTLMTLPTTHVETKKKAARKRLKIDANGNGSKPEQAADRMLEALRADGEPKTEHQLGQLAGLRGRGAHNTREAALRLLVSADRVAVANNTSSDGTPLYVLSSPSEVQPTA